MELSSFSRLEQKIEELLNQLVSLREENAELHRAIEERDQRLNEQSQRLSELESEREGVRGRIEQLVQRLETY